MSTVFLVLCSLHSRTGEGDAPQATDGHSCFHLGDLMSWAVKEVTLRNILQLEEAERGILAALFLGSKP